MSEEGVNHEGHRSRLKTALRVNGIMSLAPHEVIELILYACLPRGDVNPLAHRLLDHFGSVGALLNADTAEIINAGAGEHTASVINALGACVREYKAAVPCPLKTIGTRAEALEILESIKSPSAILLLSSRGELICAFPLEVNKEAAQAVIRAVSCDAPRAIVKCPGEDIYAGIKAALKTVGVDITD